MSTADDITTFLTQLPEPSELVRRANIIHAIHTNLAQDSDRIDTGINSQGDSRYFWEDGGGQEADIIWDPANLDHTLLLGYDHESEFNHFDTPDAYTTQIALRNLPTAYAYLGEDPALYWSWDDSKLVYASTSAWWDTTSHAWTCDPAWLQAADAARDDGGLHYCFEIFTIEPTVDTYIKHFTDQGFDDDEPALRSAVTAALTTTITTTAQAPVSATSHATSEPAQPGLLTRLRDLFN